MAAEGAPMQTYSPAYGQDPEAYGAGQSSYGSQPMGAMGQPYGGQPYGGQPYGGQPYGGQPYGGPPGGDPYGQPYGGQPGGDPSGGYQPSGEDLLLQAKEQKRQEKEAKRLRKKQADLEAGTYAVQTIVGMGLFNCILLIVPLFGTSWNSKTMIGFGVRSLSVRTDIFMMDIDVTCGKHNMIEEFVCERFTHIKGKHTLHTAMSHACALNNMACNIMSDIYWGSAILFCFIFIGVCFMLVAIIFILFYWYSAPLPKVRRIAQTCFILSPVTVAIGIGIWTCIVPDLDEIPRAWTHGLGLLGGDNGIFGLKETNDFQYGWCWIMAIVALISMCIQTILWQYLFVHHPGEEDADKKEAERRQELADREAMMMGLAPPPEAEPLLLAENPPQAYGAQGYSPHGGQYHQQL